MLPILSRGKHRNSRKGACFMEMASVLAGERWTDHPRCTHPLLGELARLVNDCTSDDHRHELAVLIPSVVGLTSDDPRMDARIALRAAPPPPAGGVRGTAERAGRRGAHRRPRARRAGGSAGRRPQPASTAALESAPRRAAGRYAFVRRAGITTKGFRRHGAPGTVARSRSAPSRRRASPTRTRCCGSC